MGLYQVTKVEDPELRRYIPTKGMKKREVLQLYAQEILFLSLLALVIVWLFIPLFTTSGLVYGDDIHRQYYFYRQFFNGFIKNGIWPWWNPYIFSGVPFIANPVVNIWYPPNWLFSVLPLSSAYVTHLGIHIWWAMAGMFLLCRFFLGKKELFSAWMGAILFGLSGFFVARVYAGHVDVIAAASWMPWVILTNAKWQLSNIKSRWGIVAALTYALQLYAGYQTMAFITGIILGLYTVMYAFTKRSILPVFKLLLLLLFATGYAGLQLIPVQEFFRRSIRTFPMPYEWHAYGALSLSSLQQLTSPFPFGTHVTYTGPPPNYAEHAFFIGRVGIVLALFSIVKLFKSRKEFALYIICFWVLILFAIWISLGPQAPFDLQKLAWEYIPMYKYLRIPSRHMVLFVFGASILSAYGLSSFGLFKYGKSLKLFVVLAVVVEMVWYGSHFMATNSLPESRHDQQLISLLQKTDKRVLPNFGVWIPPRDSFDFDSAMSYRIFSTSGYDPSILRNYYEFLNATNGAPLSQVTNDVQPPYGNIYSPYTNLLNVGYIFLPNAYDPLYGVQLPQFVFLGEDTNRQWRLYENKESIPRFFTVSSVVAFPTRERVAESIQNQKVLPNSVFAVSGAFPPSQDMLDCGEKKGDIRIISYSPNTIVLTASMPCNGVLASSEVMYPGWEATVNGVKVPLFESNLAFRTMYLSKGESTIIFSYVPYSVMVGGGVTVFFLLITLFGIVTRNHVRFHTSY